jgi:acyl-CoA synthetase (AMP-forming)/AMP-acid ligase II
VTVAAAEDLRRHTATTPDRTACVEGDLEVSYAELAACASGVAQALERAGVSAGDRVCLLLDNSVRFVIAYLATLQVQAVVVPLNPAGSLDGVADAIRDSEPRAIVAEVRRAAHVADRFGSGRSETVALPGGAQAVVQVPESVHTVPTPADPLVAMIYTSGTTGRAKGVMLSASNLRAIADAGCGFVDLGPEDRLGVVTPLFHLYGLREIDAALRAGASLVLPRGLAFPTHVLQQLHRARATGISGVPSGFLTLIDGYGAEVSSLAGHLRYLALGTAAATPSLLGVLRSALPATRVLVTYGLTELSRACYRDVLDAEGAPSSVGRPYPGVEVEIHDELGVPVGPGVEGRIVLRSAMVMRGYWRRPDLTSRTLLADGGLLTPDLGVLDRDGSLSLLGRVDDVINTGGEKVGPDEVESVLRDHPAVVDVAVTATPDPAGLLGQVVKAWVVAVPDSGLTADVVREHCAQRLEPYKVPREVEFLDRLPKTVLGKTSRTALLRPVVQEG